MRFIITGFGEPTAFKSLTDAERAIRGCGSDFADVWLSCPTGSRAILDESRAGEKVGFTDDEVLDAPIDVTLGA